MLNDKPIQEQLRDLPTPEDMTPHPINLITMPFRVLTNPDNPLRTARDTRLEFWEEGAWVQMTGVQALVLKINAQTQLFEATAWVIPYRYNGPKRLLKPLPVESGPKV